MLNSRVRHVRLKVAHRSQLARAKKSLTDALSVAVDSRASQRLYIVKKLALGKLSSRATSHRLSALIEDDVRRMQSSAVPGSRSDAHNYNAVFFEDQVSACIAFASRLASGSSTDAWFWPLAVGRYRPTMDRDAALRAALFTVLESASPVLSVAVFAAALCEQRCIMPLLMALRHEDIAQLHAYCGIRSAMTGNSARKVFAHNDLALSTAALRLPYAEDLSAALQTWSAAPGLKVWLATVLLIAGAPQRAAEADLRTQAQQWLAAVESYAHPSEIKRTLLNDAGVQAVAPLAEPMQSEYAMHRENADAEIRIRKRQVPHVAAVSARNAHNQGLVVDERHPGIDYDLRVSNSAGLLFLINAATRLGLPQWLADNSDWQAWGLVPRLFESLANRLKINADDPIMASLPKVDLARSTLKGTTATRTSPEPVPILAFPRYRKGRNVQISHHDSVSSLAHARRGARVGQSDPEGFVLPSVWRTLTGASDIERQLTGDKQAHLLTTLSGRLPLAGWYEGAMPNDAAVYASLPSSSRLRPYYGSLEDALIEAWITAMRLWCRRFCGMGMLGVVRRTGYIVFSSTHIDVSFDINTLDFRIRRAGLDLDPGWVSWFGRIVNFHYGAAPR